MNDEQLRQVRTGGDPRSQPQFTALRNEISKLTHPARPEVDWKEVERLSLSLFEINGVDLQTGTWYTLARSHLAQVSGLNEGMSILASILRHQWTQLWPQPVYARVKIINNLLRLEQKLFRTFSLESADIPSLVLAEKYLLEIKDILRRQELEHACQINSLMQLIRSVLSRLENCSLSESVLKGDMMQEQVIPITEDAASAYVIRKEPEVRSQVAEDKLTPLKRWPIFVAGMATAVILSVPAVFCWKAFHHPDEASLAMAASIAQIPEAMTPTQIAAFLGSESSQSDSEKWLSHMSSQLIRVTSLAPGWRLRYGQGLVEQAKALWPDDPATQELVERWEHYQAGRRLPLSELNGWHDGMMQLRTLSAQLDALDWKKGKYITGSELKTIIWRITGTFASTVPVEEQLRQLVPTAEGTNASPQNLEQVARRLDSLSLVLEQLSAKKLAEKSVQITP